MLFRIAFRNLWARRLRTVVVGSILTFGAMLAVLGGSLVDSLSKGMERGVTRSTVGDIQVYSDQAKEAFALFTSGANTMPDIGHIEDFAPVKRALMQAFPEIKAVVPQGINTAMVMPGNILDVKLAQLRQLYKQGPAARAKREDLKAHLRAIIAVAQHNLEENLVPTGAADPVELPKNRRSLKKALSPAFWAGLDAHADAGLEFLENDIAPLIFEDNQIFFYYLGTIPHQMAEAFPLVEMVRGTMVPEGSRGFLMNEYVMENQIKHRVARRMDAMDKALRKDHKTLAGSDSLRADVDANVGQVDDLLGQLSPADAAALDQELGAFLGAGAPVGLRARLEALLRVDDANFRAHYDCFYRAVAPRIVLYTLNVGDTFPLKTVTQSGFANALNVKIYGTFRFKSFESSPVAGYFNLMDLASFRDLYGFMTPERRAQQQALAAAMAQEAPGLDLDRADFESMFTRKKALPKAAPSKPASGPRAAPAPPAAAVLPVANGGSDAAMEQGPCLNAAIVLKDPSQAKRLIPLINQLSKDQHLGIQAVGWESASGLLGQLAGAVKVLLFLFIAIIFLVATFIIQNAMAMATMERTVEIGTLRAIGAKRSLVLKMVFLETGMLAIVFSGLGVALGLGVVLWLGSRGIPAPNEQLSFLFAGSRLYLGVEPGYLLAVLAFTVTLSLAASVYPAWRANRISPLRAMQSE